MGGEYYLNLTEPKLDTAYKQEKGVDVKERILLVRRIIEDKQHIEEVAKELHRCRAWAYKWYDTTMMD
jgi:hypothetical protein